jgi:hypothetical protein
MSKSSEHPALMSSGNIDRVSSGIVKEGINDAPFRVTVMEHIDRPYRVDLSRTRTDRGGPLPPIQRRTGFGHKRAFDTGASIGDNPIHWTRGREVRVNRLGRKDPLPSQMQGRWMGVDDPRSELIVDGGEITCFGAVVNYDHKVIVEEDRALTVGLGVDDDSRLDDFQRENITGLVMTSDGRFLVYNVRFGLEFVRPIS